MSEPETDPNRDEQDHQSSLWYPQFGEATEW